jgi:hypothetical protein
MKTLITLVVEAILNWLWRVGLEAHKKQMKIKAQKDESKARSNVMQHELAVYRDLVTEVLESDIEEEVRDELLVESARSFLYRIERL